MRLMRLGEGYNLEKIKLLLKNNKFFYYIYRGFFNTFLNFLKFFIKVDENVVLFNSFGGQKFDDSPKAIYDYMIKNDKYKNYKFYWAFNHPEKYSLERGEKIKNNTFKYFFVALKAKFWISNSGIERGLKFKNKKTLYINTWHGTTIKKLGNDQNNNLCKFKTTKPDIMYAQGKYDIDTLSSAFNIDKSHFVLSGLPRNDSLSKAITKTELKDIKSKLNIPSDRKVIIYMPTFREFDKDKNGSYIAPPINLSKWKKNLKDEYVLLFRAHYETKKILGIKNDKFVYDVSSYEPLEELLKISDVLISDYSSVMFDYSILGRPIFSFAYDYEKYIENRGVYIDIRKELPNGICENEDQLLEKIKNCNYEEEIIKSRNFKNKYIEKYGNASSYIDNIIK